MIRAMNRQMNRKQRRQMARVAPAQATHSLLGAPSAAAGLFAKAFQHFQAGRLPEAMDLYQQTLAADPKHADSLHHLGLIAHKLDRNDVAVDMIGRAIAVNGANAEFHYNISVVLAALGRFADVERHSARAIALKPDNAGAHILLGDACLKLKKLDQAIAAYQQGLALDPADAEARNNLAEALLAQGRNDEAAPHFEEALRRKPAIATAYHNLAMIHFVRGDKLTALNLIVQGLRIKETPSLQTLFVSCLRFGGTIPDSPLLRHYVVRAMSEPWGSPGRIAYASIALVKCDPRIQRCIDRAVAAWPTRLSDQDLFGPDGLQAVSTDLVLSAVLQNSQIVNDIPLERFLTLARSALLEKAIAISAANTADEATLTFACLLARLCFSNEYVFACADDEAAQVALLRDRVVAALRSGDPIAALPLALIASYEPLYSIPDSETLLARSWPGAIGDLLTQQVREPLAQRTLRNSILRLTPIDDDVSLLVQNQYEESPYPRWVKCAADENVDSIDATIQREFPYSSYRPVGKAGRLDVLIAGCGTGQQAVLMAKRYSGAQILAADLSLSSLSYAKYRTDALGLDNIDYGQADILRLASLKRDFDVIACSGVLHHLADPLVGWRVLLSMLRPKGIMHIALYSKLARTGIVAAREFIAMRGYRAVADDIRRCRQDIIALDEAAPARKATVWSTDFYAMSNCRDLVFHVQEHHFTLPQIKTFLAENGLALLGFEHDPDILHSYRAQFSDDPAATDLDHWHAFEQQNPNTFGRMYQFIVQKPA
jgi:Flp pilus assembly protein TadD/2-polyprenyl-3-methyl-5-hydroxy-6-metoxy-1,4-benzoquinol methylase